MQVQALSNMRRDTKSADSGFMIAYDSPGPQVSSSSASGKKCRDETESAVLASLSCFRHAFQVVKARGVCWHHPVEHSPKNEQKAHVGT